MQVLCSREVDLDIGVVIWHFPILPLLPQIQLAVSKSWVLCEIAVSYQPSFSQVIELSSSSALAQLDAIWLL